MEREEFTPTELKSGSSKVFNSVQRNGVVSITSKSRPEMLIMTFGKC